MGKKGSGFRRSLFLAAIVAGASAAAALPAPAPAAECVNPAGTGGCFASIQAAIDAAAPGETVAIRPGVYREPVTATKSVQLLGTGRTPRSVVIDGGGVLGTAVMVLAADVRLRNLTVRNSGASLVGIAAPGARLNRVVLRGAGADCVRTTAIDTRIVGARISSCGRGIEALGSAALLQNVSVTTAQQECVDIIGDGFSVLGARLRNCGTYGIRAQGSGIVAGSSVTGSGADGIVAAGPVNVVVRDSVVTGAGGRGIFANAQALSVTDNRVSGAALCVQAVCGAGCSGGEVLRNTVSDCRLPGVSVVYNEAPMTIAGNRVAGAVGMGVYVSGSGAFTVGGNRTSGVFGIGYAVSAASPAQIYQNVAADSRGLGFFFSGSGSTLRSNLSVGALQGGFVVSGGTGNTLEGNVARAGNYPFCDMATGTTLVGNSFTASDCPPPQNAR